MNKKTKASGSSISVSEKVRIRPYCLSEVSRKLGMRAYSLCKMHLNLQREVSIWLQWRLNRVDGWKGAKNRSVKWSILTLTSLSSPVQVQSLLGHLTLASSILRWHATSEKICKIIRGQKNHIIEEKWNGTLDWYRTMEGGATIK